MWVKIKFSLLLLLLSGVSLWGCAEEKPVSPNAGRQSGSSGKSESKTNNPFAELEGMVAYTEPMMTNKLADNAPTHKVNLSEFGKEIEDSMASNAKYAGSWIEVEGLLSSISPHMFNTYERRKNSNEYVVSVLLQSDDKKQSINCWMKAGEHPWEQAADDEKLTLRGAYGWHLGGGVLLECQVIKQSPKKLLNVDVDELAKQFEADPEAFHKAHNGHHILVTGKYAGHHARPGNPKAVNDEWIALEGSKGRRFHAEIGSSVYDQRPYSKIKMGEQTTIIGSLSYVSLDDLKFEDLATTATQNMTPFMPQPKTLAK